MTARETLLAEIAERQARVAELDALEAHAYRHRHTATADALEAIREVSLYLLGEGELDGKWFGEGPPEGKHPYWWRKNLRAAIATPLFIGLFGPSSISGQTAPSLNCDFKRQG